MSTYMEKLKDPRWQKKRLKILERDKWACCECGSNLNTLNVHHDYYERGKAPWDYPDESLITLCDYCHEEERTARAREESFLLQALRERQYSCSDLNEIAHAIYENNFDHLCKYFREHADAKD